ncbi:MAG: NifB/NifX family molybdenum-iron cluster-binding protein [Oligoflexia bacterium]|nr:NifB/NifX family molybdenum-iron cluster-binding protein [Oligoflexia bacterium]
MIVCITSQNNSTDSEIDPRFGRAAYFIIYDTEAKKTNIIKNDNMDGSSGVGIQSAQVMINNKVEYVITGNIGPKAGSALNAANIKVKEGATGKVIDAINSL